MASRTRRRSRWSSPSAAGAPAKFTVGVQVCDEASAASPLPSPAKCARNAKAFAADPGVVAVLGPVTSTCTAATLPIVNGAPGGPLPVISMSNTYLGLTRAGPGVGEGPSRRALPDRRAQLRPDGAR